MSSNLIIATINHTLKLIIMAGDKFYEGMEVATFSDGTFIYTGTPSHKEDWMEYYHTVVKDACSGEHCSWPPAPRTDVEEVMNHYLPEYQTAATRRIITFLCNKEKVVGLWEFLWYIKCYFGKLRDEQYSLSDRIHNSYVDKDTPEYKSRKIRYDQVSHELDCICIHDAGRVF